MVKRLLTTLLIALLVVSFGYGQTGQTGAIKGTVTDPDGVTLPGITVILKSPALVLPQLTTVTNSNGMYRFPMLAPGTYELTFMLEGMDTLVRQGIVVNIGKTATVDVGMKFKSIEESVVVSGKAPTIDRQSTAGAANIGEEYIQSIPTAGRSYGDFFNMAPGITGDTAYGSAQQENAYTLDGVNMGDPTTGTQYVTIGADIMEEISVQSGGLSAEHGSVKGAVVNVVTKSGGNSFSGSASFYYNHESLQSENTKGTPLHDPDGNSDKTGQKYQVEPGITLGGPIVKDKLWFFTNLSFRKSETYAPGYPYNKAEGESDTPSDLLELFPYAKLTLHPNQKNKFILSYSYTDYQMNHRDASRYDTLDTTTTQRSPMHIINFHWTRFFGENFFANLKLAAIKSQLKWHAKHDEPYYVNVFSGLAYGAYWRNQDDSKRDRYQVNIDATTFMDDFMGSHELKIGAELQYADTNWIIKTIPHPVNGASYLRMAPEYFGEPGYYQGYVFPNNGFERQERILNLSAFVNDSWSITNNITLNLGVRLDVQKMIWPAQNQDEEPMTILGTVVDRRIPETITPYTWTTISPRLGLIYDLFKDGTTLFKASYSRLVSPNLTDWVNTAHPNGWFYYRVSLRPSTGAVIPGSIVPASIPGTVQVGYNGQDLDAPYADEITLGLEREMWEDWSLGLRYIRKWDRKLIHTVDASALDIDALLEDGTYNWIDYEPVQILDPYSGEMVTFYNDLDPSRLPEEYIINAPGAKRDFDGVELTLNKRYSHGWAVNASYVYSNSRGLISTARDGQSLGTSGLYHSPNSHMNASGRFPLERRHIVKVTGLVKGPLGINISGYYRYMSGRRWTRSVSSDHLTDILGYLNQGDVVVNAEKRGSRGLPALNMLDLRVEKAFTIKNWQLKVFADVFNVFNANTATSVYTESSDPVYTFGETNDIIAPRVVRLGAKIEFN